MWQLGYVVFLCVALLIMVGRRYGTDQFTTSFVEYFGRRLVESRRLSVGDESAADREQEVLRKAADIDAPPLWCSKYEQSARTNAQKMFICLDVRSQVSSSECDRRGAQELERNGETSVTIQGEKSNISIQIPSHHGKIGRTGNRIQQILHVAAYAIWAGIPMLKLPVGKSHQLEGHSTPLGLPEVIQMPLGLQQNWWVRNLYCSGGPFGNFWELPCRPKIAACCSASWTSMYRDVCASVIWPNIDERFKNCTEPSNETLTIHGRYGDLGADQRGHHTQARIYPCLFYDKLISTYKFTRVIFTVEPDDVYKHPCIPVLKKHASVSLIIVTSFSGAVCNFAKASNLVVPLSTLSEALSFANNRIQRIFGTAQEFSTHASFARLSAEAPATGCHRGSPEVHLFSFEGFQDWKRKGEAKVRYLTNESLEVTAHPTRCLL